MPSKRKRGASKNNSTPKQPSLADIFGPQYQEDESVDDIPVKGVLSVPNFLIPTKVKDTNQSNDEDAMKDEDEEKPTDASSISAAAAEAHTSGSTPVSQLSSEEFTNLLLSSSMFPCTQLELEIERYINGGKKRTHWERDLDVLQQKIDSYREKLFDDALLDEILDLLQELNLDSNVTLLAKYLGRQEEYIKNRLLKRKKMRFTNVSQESQKEHLTAAGEGEEPASADTITTGTSTQSPMTKPIFPDAFSTQETTLDILFNQKSNIFFSLPDSQVNSMVVSLQFLIYNNEFVIQYGSQRQICQYNPITNSFLQEIAAGILPKVLMESLETLPQVKFYEGCLLVELIDYRTKLRLKQVYHSSSRRANNGTTNDASNTDSHTSNGTAPVANGTSTEETSTQKNVASTASMRPKSVKLLLKPDISAAFENAKQFLEENCHDLTEEEKYEALQHILNTINQPLKLNPNPKISHISNAIHYNHNKHKFRRLVKRTVSRTLMPSNPALASMTIQSSMMRTRKHDHSLLNHIVTRNWRKDKPADWIKVLPKGSVKPKPNFMKQLTEDLPPKKQGLRVKSPLDFLQQTHEFTKNYRKAVRILQFQAVHDPQRLWRIEIFPAHKGRRYDCILAPSGQPPSKWVIGSKHAAELYGARLKDMFTSNGKTYCSGDAEVDYALWEEKRKRSAQAPTQQQQQQQNSTPNTASSSNIPTGDAARQLAAQQQQQQQHAGGAQPQQRPYVQITNNMRVQNGQMQNLPYNSNFQMQMPQNQALQGNIHAPQLHQFINQQQQKKRD